MDLKKTEKTLLKLEENAVKVNEVTKYVEKFEGLVSEVKTISEGIKNNSASIELRISDVDKKLMENMNDLSKELKKTTSDLSKQLMVQSKQMEEHRKKQDLLLLLVGALFVIVLGLAYFGGSLDFLLN